MLRASFYDDWTVGSNSGDPSFTPGSTNYTRDCTLGVDNCYDGDWIFDAEIGYTLNDRYDFVIGAQNLFDENGPLDLDNVATGTVVSGNEFTTSSPWGFDGGFYYFRFVANLDY
jgi:iron complex outermembrane receptor protein